MKRKIDVALISMPFGPLMTPSLGLGLLKAALTRAGIASRTFYFTIRYAELIGERLYTRICDETQAHDLVGEWIFSNALFNHQTDCDVRRYIDEILWNNAPGASTQTRYLEPPTEGFVTEILSARSRVEMFLEACLQMVLSHQPKIVGFTSIFQQQVASLSLARRIKARSPETYIVFGGANCEGIMGREVHRQFPFIDAAVSGEGDLIFPTLVRRVIAGDPTADLPGVFCRDGRVSESGNGSWPNTPPLEDMDALPIPDFDEYFDRWKQSSLRPSQKPRLLFETSRGCWWGEKHHCTFCGLNGNMMAYRSKSSPRALTELLYLIDKYPGHHIDVVDNILDPGYFKEFIPALAERNLGLEIYYEVKANLKKDQLRLLRAAGMTTIQPGIESFSDQVLRLMRKGVRALQNIQLLKWCMELGITAQWNFLWGFPGESNEEYQRMAGLIPLLTHFQPPQVAATIRLDRFSPNFNQAEEFGFKNVAPYPAYRHVYPLAPDAVANLAYFFTFEYSDHRDLASYVTPLAKEIASWQQCHQSSQLFQTEKEEQLLIWDFRPIAAEPLTVLTGDERFFYLACDQIRTPRQILDQWRSQSDRRLDLTDIRDALEVFTASGLMLRQDESYLALAVPGLLDRNSPT